MSTQIQQSSGGVQIQIHPLVILNVGDHANRAKYIKNRNDDGVMLGPYTKVVGALLGK